MTALFVSFGPGLRARTPLSVRTPPRRAYSPDQPRDDHGRFGSKGGDDKIAHVNAIMEHIDEQVEGHTAPNDQGSRWGRTDTSEETLGAWGNEEVAALNAAGYHGDDVAAAVQEWGWGGTDVLREPDGAERYDNRDGGGPDFGRGATETLDFIAHNEISAPLERGWAMRAEVAKDLKPGDALRAGPTSWTTDPEIADTFSTYRMSFSDGRVPVTIHNDGPVHGIYAAALVPSDYAWQHEVIVNEPALTVTRIERHDDGGADVWVKASSAKAAAAVSPDVLGEELFGETFGQVSARVEGRKVRRAYSPDQPRDSHGRFGEGEAPTRYETDPTKPGWHKVLHTSSVEGIRSIEEHGFDPMRGQGLGGNFGMGGYFNFETPGGIEGQKHASDHMRGKERSAAQLEMAVDYEHPLAISSTEFGNGSFGGPAYIDLADKAGFHKEWKDWEKHGDWREPAAEAITRMVQDRGYDAIVWTDPNNRFPEEWGDQVVVFRPQQVRVIDPTMRNVKGPQTGAVDAPARPLRLMTVPDFFAQFTARRAYSPDQPRDDHGRFGEGSSTIKDWAKGHPRGTLYRAMSKTDLARVRASGTLTGSRAGEVWVSNVAKDEYLSKDEVLVAIKPERGDVTGAGAPGDLKLREVPASRIIDVYDPLTAERRARTNAAMQGAAFNEEDHPRDEHGRFTSEGGRSALDKKFTERTVGSSSLRGPSYKAKAEGARAIAEHGVIPAAVMGRSMDEVFVTPPGSTSRLDTTLNLLKTNGGGDFARTPGIPNDFAIKSDGATVEQFGELNDLSHQLITMNEMFTDDQEPNADKSAIGRAIGALQSPASVEDVLAAARSADPKLDLNGERGIAAMYIDQWAHTSGDHDPIAIATQITAGRVYGASTADIEHHFASSGGHMEDLQPTIDAERPVTEAVLGGMHNATQAYLGSLGFSADDKIAMFRGVTSKGPIPDLPSLDHLGTNPMSAWTTDAHQAEIFASNDVYGYVARSEVNVRDVIATPFTGMGALYQHEAVLIGDGATRPVTIEPATSAAKIEAPVRAAASTFGLLWIDEPPNDDWLKTLARAKGKTVTRIDINGPVNVNIKPRQAYSPDQPRDDHGRFGTGGSTVDQLVHDNPQRPGEAVFEWQSRLVQGLDPQTQSDVLFAARERYPVVPYIRDGADKWCADHGLPLPPKDIVSKPCDIKEADAVARYFERTPDQSADPRVQAAYADFKSQNEAMYAFMTKPEAEGGMGIKVDMVSTHDPYKTAADQAEDLRNNHHISIESGLGGAHDFTMTTDEYDRFRAVHDVFGHAGVGGGFDRHGEYEAWLMHSSMYTDGGRAAMSTEYHAVNSALWSGEKGTPGTGKSILLPNQYASPPWDRQAAALVAGPDYSVKELVRKLGLDSTFAQQFDDCPMHPHAHAPRRAYSPDQPRDDHGRWGTGGGAGGDIAEGIASGGHKGTPDDPIRVGKNLDLAARLIAQGKSVRLDQPDQVATLLGKLNAIANDAKEKGVKAPNYNLCNVSVEGSNLFCHDSKGIPRVEMPQFKGMAVPGSPAASMTPNAKGEVNIGDAFLQHVQDQGIAVKETSIDSSHLRASQNELVGTQVAGMVQAAQDGKLDLASERIYTTRDNYIIDGHHRWAADVGLSYVKGQPMQTPVYQLDMDIGQALDMANEFATQQGIAPKKGAALAAALSAVSQILDGKVTHVRIVPPFS